MNKLTNTAKKLDTFFKICNIFLRIAGIVLLVGLVIISAGLLFGLDPEMIGSGYNSISFGSLELTIAQDYAPNPKLVLILTVIQVVLALVICLVVQLSFKCIRQILAPMAAGEPFHSAVSGNLKKLAKYTLIQGIVVNVVQGFTTGLLAGGYDLTGLLISDKITHITINETFDLTFLLVAAVFLLMSYIFRYGEELQQLSDETL